MKKTKTGLTLPLKPTLLRTTKFDHKWMYPINASLFIENGLLTTNQPNNKSQAVGYVLISPTKNKSAYLHCWWAGVK